MNGPRPPVRGLRIRRTLAAVFGLLGAVGLLFLAVGLLRSGPGEVERSVDVEAPPEALFPYLDSLALWDRWTVWGDMETVFSGPGRGEGATRSWDDDIYGAGTLTLLSSEPHRLVTYAVEVEGGALSVRGTLQLAPGSSGTRVVWREEGRMRRNPLLGYVAGGMARSQGQEMERSLERLRAALEDGG